MKMDRREFLGTCAAALEFFNPVSIGNYQEPNITDCSGYIRSGFKRVKRAKTDFVVLHATDTDSYFDFMNTLFQLNTLLSKDRNAHYLIGRDGHIYGIVPDELVAYHAGVSRWNGQKNLNMSSVGVEFVGISTKPFTSAQYDAFQYLYREMPGSLKEKYDIKDSDVLFHSWVAYCPDDVTHKKLGLKGKHIRAHRGRKSDPGVLFDRKAAGVFDSPLYDPDVKNGSLLPSSGTKEHI